MFVWFQRVKGKVKRSHAIVETQVDLRGLKAGLRGHKDRTTRVKRHNNNGVIAESDELCFLPFVHVS